MYKFIFIDRLNCRAISEGKNAKATKSHGIDTSINQQFKSSSDKIASVATISSFSTSMMIIIIIIKYNFSQKEKVETERGNYIFCLFNDT